MSERPGPGVAPVERHGLGDRVAAKEARRLRARRTSDRTLWLGVRTFGVVGWSIAVPTLIGLALGMWLDRTWPARFSWTLALMMAGVTVGCFTAWHWVQSERREIDQEE